MVKEEHCDRNSLLSVDTDDVAAHGAQSAQDGPQRLNNQQKQKVVGKNLNLVLLTTLVPVPWYAWIRGDAKITCDHTLQLLRR